MTKPSTPLTPEQIANWRNMLCMRFGAYGLFLTDDEIQEYRDRLQADIASFPPADADPAPGLLATEQEPQP